jgi:hypothetical protein
MRYQRAGCAGWQGKGCADGVRQEVRGQGRRELTHVLVSTACFGAVRKTLGWSCAPDGCADALHLVWPAVKAPHVCHRRLDGIIGAWGSRAVLALEVALLFTLKRHRLMRPVVHQKKVKESENKFH